MRPWRLPLLAALAVLALSWPPGSLEAQCAMCRTALGSPEGQAMAQGFRHAILLLLAVPLALVGTLGLAIYRATRAARQEAADPGL